MGICRALPELQRARIGHAAMALRLQHRTTTLSTRRKTTQKPTTRKQPPWVQRLACPIRVLGRSFLALCWSGGTERAVTARQVA
jgi:hypothetical protein